MNNLTALALEFPLIKAQLAEFCAFSLGQAYIAELEPSFDYLTVKQQLALTKELLALAVKYQGLDFSGVKDVSLALQASLKNQTCLATELVAIALFNQASERLARSYLTESTVYPILTDYLAALHFNQPLSQLILNKLTLTGEVKPDASPQLKSLLKQKQQLEERIDQALTDFRHRNSDILMEDLVVSRHDRQVLLVKSAFKNKFPGLIYGESASGQAVYFEPMNLVNLNNELFSVLEAIEQELAKILWELSQAVKTEALGLLANLETLTYLDAVNAMALWGKKHNAIVPELTKARNLYLKQARHPLIDAKIVVPNTYRLLAEKPVVLITGPNTGGKTVSLKIIGLAVWMAHAGIPLLAEEALIPLVDQVYVDIGDEQSVESSLSTFSAHLAKQAQILQQVTPSSLVLLDELGGGTDPKEGEGLAIAIIEALKRRQILTVVTTHLSGLKTYGSAQPDILVASVEFDLAELKPTFRYLEGYVGQSNALEIALRYGFEPQLINRAKAIINELKTAGELQLESLTAQKQVLIKEAETLAQKEAELALQATALAEKQTALATKEATFEKTLAEKELAILEKTQDEMDGLLAELKQAKAQHDLALGQKQVQAFQKRVKQKQPTKKPLAVGDRVKYKYANQLGEVVKLTNKYAEVIINKQRLKAPLTDLELVAPAVVSQPVVERTISVNRQTGVELELNLVGQRVAEAIPLLEKHLDECLLAQMPFTKIIHGVGTGQLKKAVRATLQRFPYIKNYRDGDFNDGGSGVTIVEFG